MGINTINLSSIDLLLDEIENLKALQIQMNRKVDLISSLADEVEKVIDCHEDTITYLNRELHSLDRTG